MSKATRREVTSRADARRRSRQLERGEEPMMEASETADRAEPARPQRPGLLSSLFPPAPPLPGKPDPLAGFRYRGPLASLAAWFYILGRNPRGWLLPAIPWAAAQTLTMFTPAPLVVARLTFGGIGVVAALIAGWIGWQKPWLFGLATALAGTLIEAIFLALVPGNLARGTSMQWFTYAFVIQIAQFSWLYGALMGWYAGYFRRRLTAQRGARPTQRRR
jgi:hypothetical protein